MTRFVLASALAATFALVAPAAAEAKPRPAAAKKSPKKRITVDLHEADLHNVLRLFADVSGKNLVVADDVQGKVTIKLKKVPWDRALRVILKSHGLGMDTEGDIIRIAPQARLDAEQQRALDLEQAWVEKTPLRTKIIPVSYARAQDMVPLVEGLLSPRGTVTWDERTNVLVVRDVVDSDVFDRY